MDLLILAFWFVSSFLSKTKTSPNMWKGDEMPISETPEVIKSNKGYKITNNAPELNMAYRIKNKNDNSEPWKLYQGKTIFKNIGDTLIVRSHRIGYKPNEVAVK